MSFLFGGINVVEMMINGYHTNEPVITLLDDEDYKKFCHWRWQESREGYARRNRQVIGKDGMKQWQTVQLHRAIMGLVGVDTKDCCVDHINGNRLDNRKENLRIVSLSENSSNRHITTASTGVLCVSQCENSYIARVSRNYKKIYLGSYKTPEEARKAVELYNQRKIRPQIRNKRKVVQIKTDGSELGVFNSCAEAQRKTGVCSSNISRCASGRRATAGGFIWRYK